MKPIYKWNGQYFGFISNRRLFDANNNYMGWLEDDGRVWKADGQYLGEVVEGDYILRNTTAVRPVSRVPRVSPVPPVPSVPRVNRVGRVGRVSYVDALDELDID